VRPHIADDVARDIVAALAAGEAMRRLIAEHRAGRAGRATTPPSA
jgi:hypothetical protein